MSFLVSLPLATYRSNALDGSSIDPEFTLGNAQAMIWLSQLAYETDDEGKVDQILKAWKLELVEFGPDPPDPGLVPPKARFIVAAGRRATFVTFSGTDPLSIKDWITDFTLSLRLNTLHEGFRAAVMAVQSKIERAIRKRSASEQPLFFTGHSMGGALANISAMLALKAGLPATAVYTFGGPRTGGQEFVEDYEPLADRTFRLAHGNDIVPAVPPSLFGNFHHVGRMLRCSHGSSFGQNPEPKGGDGPSLIQIGLSTLNDFDLDKVPSIEDLRSRRVDPRTLDQSRLLPEVVSDHVPAGYFRALGVTL
jgi:triacylglycerol lipase